MRLTQKIDVVDSASHYPWTLLLAASALAGLPLMGCSTEPDDGLNDTSQPLTAASALQTSNPTPSTPQPTSPQAPKGGTADVTITFNHAPRVTNMLSDLGRLDVGDLAHLRVVADDQDGDPLFYAWETKCQGTFDHPFSPAPTFVLAAIQPSGVCDLVVSVTDGRGGQNSGTLTLAAAAPPPIVVADPGSGW
jgi:hypothetical protein